MAQMQTCRCKRGRSHFDRPLAGSRQLHILRYIPPAADRASGSVVGDLDLRLAEGDCFEWLATSRRTSPVAHLGDQHVGQLIDHQWIGWLPTR